MNTRTFERTSLIHKTLQQHSENIKYQIPHGQNQFDLTTHNDHYLSSTLYPPSTYKSDSNEHRIDVFHFLFRSRRIFHRARLHTSPTRKTAKRSRQHATIFIYGVGHLSISQAVKLDPSSIGSIHVRV